MKSGQADVETNNYGNFWQMRLQMNASQAIFHQWEQLEKTHCIDNFRIVGGSKEGFREGYFFADSDAYKWLDAAARILAKEPSPQLEALVDAFIAILEKAQCKDGYLYTYNQIHFGQSRWQNLQIEHEMYCMGHLIEAGVSHFTATGKESLIGIARRAANLLVETFLEAPPIYTDGHEEIEIALIRLSRCTGNATYRDLAKRLLERRGRISIYGFRFLVQTLRAGYRMSTVRKLREKYLRSHPESIPFSLPRHNQHVTPRFVPLRMAASALGGKYTQQHVPLSHQVEPVGHAVRFTYLNTAAAMLAYDENDQTDLPRMVKVWEQMITRRMFVTGGIGSLPLIEGFGRDYELDPSSAYAETCAALGSMLWTREMSRLTGEPRYEDLFEWQLYNASSVGVGLEGKTYFYNNPLTCRSGIERQNWYDIPCCPSNLSRSWASLRENAASLRKGSIYIDQYIPGEYELEPGVKILIFTKFPWEGEVHLRFCMKKAKTLNLALRIPAWAGEAKCVINREEQAPSMITPLPSTLHSAVGLNFESSRYLHLQKEFKDQDELDLSISMPLRLRRQDKRIKGCGGMVALTRGPLVYCMESIDNRGDIFSVALDPDCFGVGYESGLLGGTVVIDGRTQTGDIFRFIPYMLWGNRGRSEMTVFFKST